MPEIVVGTNSYASIEEADAYMETRLHADSWPESDDSSPEQDDIKAKALIWATRILDRTYFWNGCPTSQDQPLAWPRTGLCTPNGADVPSDEIPELLKQATTEIALSLIVGDRTADDDSSTLSSLTAGPVSLEFREGVEKKTVADAAALLIPGKWGSLQQSGISFSRVVRA